MLARTLAAAQPSRNDRHQEDEDGDGVAGTPLCTKLRTNAALSADAFCILYRPLSPSMSGVVHTLPPRGRGRGGVGAKQFCSCKANVDGRCCSTKSCGCLRLGLGCSPACNCRGFKLVCANVEAPLDKPVPKPACDKQPAAKKAKSAFSGEGRKLADPDDPGAAPPDRSAFLDALERQQQAAAAAAQQAAREQEQEQEQAASALPAALATAAAPLAAGTEEDVIDLCDSDSDVDPAPAAAPPAPAPAPAPKPRPAAVPRPAAAAPVEAYNPFSPAQYVPAGGFAKLGGELRVHETARLRTVDGAWMGGLNACLDTGNEGCTLLTVPSARRAGLVDQHGVPVGTFGRCETREVRGVVAGAVERVSMLQIEYAIQGKSVKVHAGVSTAQLGCDLLVSRHDLLLFQADGFTLSAKR